jgi:uncharacterized protein YbjQ (UPF0145 family)
MKKSILLLLTTVLMAGCYPIRFSYHQSSVVLDYSEYTKRGFFLTEANSVSFEYQALGSIFAKVTSGYEILSETSRTGMSDDLYGATASVKRKVKYGNYKQAYTDDALKVLYAKAREINANGVINLQFTYTPAEYDLKTGLMTYPDGVIITGMAIRKL